MAENGAVQDELKLRQVLDYFGKTLEEMKEWSSSDAVHQ